MRGNVFKKTVLWMCAAAFVAVVVLDVFLIISPSWALKSASSLCFLAGGIFGFASDGSSSSIVVPHYQVTVVFLDRTDDPFQSGKHTTT